MHFVIGSLVGLAAGIIGVGAGHYWDVFVTKRDWQGWHLG